MPGRNAVAFWIFIAIVVIAHLVLRVAIGLDATAPDLLTVAVLLAARRLPVAAAAAVGLALGVLTDALSLTRFGISAFIYAVIGPLGARSRDLFEGESLTFVVVYVFFGKWLYDAAYFLLTRAVNGAPWSVLVTSALLAAVYAAVSAVVALTLYRAATGER